ALVTSLLGELRELRNSLSPPQQVAPEFISTKEACALLGECKNTLYNKARNGVVPGYKNPGGKGWRFIRSELLDYMASGKPKSQAQAYDEMVAEINKGLRPGGRNKSCRL
ncbi:helix-turn-helix domain-containing protein, partial [uncultured Muribaculum sp.]